MFRIQWSNAFLSRCLGILLLTGSVAAADVQTGVVRSGGRPIPGAAVTADCGADRITTVTDGEGRFEMGGLPSTPCRFSAAMFGFEASQQDVKASASALILDLKLQTRASLPPAPAAPVAASTARTPEKPVETASSQPPSVQAPASATPNAPPPNPSLLGPGRGGNGRGANGRGVGRGALASANAGGRGGQNNAAPAQGNTGFQSLSLTQNGDAPASDADLAPGALAGIDSGGGANEAFTISGSLSQAVQAQPGDGLGFGPPGGPGGLGFGGPGGGFGAQGLDAGAGGAEGGGANVFAGGAAGGGGRGGPGGPGGPGGGGRGGGAGGRGGGRGPGRPAANGRTQFGNRVNRGRGQQWRITAFETLGNSVLNARPYSFTSSALSNGQEIPKAAYASNNFGFSVGGPLEIPHLFRSDKTFWFVNYRGVRSKTGTDQNSSVPTLAQRNGDFSALLPNTVIYNPATNAPFANNVIPQSLLNPTALALLNYYPLPNAAGVKNYHLITANPRNNDNLQVTVNQTVTSKDRLTANVTFQDSNSVNITPFGFLDPGTGSGLNSTLTYSRTISRSLINNLVFQFSRSRNNTYSYFSNGADIEGNLGITGVFDTPLTYGPPSLSFNNFTGLSDASPSVSRSQTTGLTESLLHVHGKHTITYGGLFQRRQTNLLTTQNARGSFSFSGVGTQQIGANGLPVTGTGYDFADYLLNYPYNTSVNQYLNGNNSYYFRESVGTAYVSDDFRWKSNFSIISGLRWEYFGPYTEKNDRLANLDIAPGYTGVAVVTPGQTGPLTQTSYPAGLIKPDYKLFSPREGIAWKPWKNRQLVIRAGYGIYYTGAVYSNFPTRLGLQQPFVNAINETNSAANPLTFQNGFSILPEQKIQNTYSVDPNYKPAYAQSWNYSMQQTLLRNYVLQLGYIGTKGTHLDVVQSPNRAPLGSAKNSQELLAITNAGTFQQDLSVGNSNYNALQVSFLRRQARNRSFNITYVFAKAIDDTSTLGGGVVQIVNNIAAERALSNYDVRHTVRANYQIQSPVGRDRTGVRWDLLRGWQLNGQMTASSGTPFTATVSGDPSGTGIPGQARAESTGLPASSGSGFFNPLAFAVPVSATFGDTGRNTIPGIAQFNMLASLTRTFRFKERHQMTLSITSTNPLNHVNITGIGTVIGSINENLPQSAAGMRTLTAQTRFTF